MLLARYTNWNRPCGALWRRLRLQRVKMRNDAIDVKVNKGLLSFLVGVGIGRTLDQGTIGPIGTTQYFAEGGDHRPSGAIGPEYPFPL